MTRKEALNILESVETDFTLKNDKFEGLKILSNHSSDMHIEPGHDIIWCCNFDETIMTMTKEEIIKMSKLGWFPNEDSWAHF